ncbi:MAG: transcription-repair coupling factor [Patescibacteria group bacterium]
MQAREVLTRLKQADSWRNLEKAVFEPDGLELLTGLNHAQKSLFTAALYLESPRTIVLITHSPHQASIFHRDLATFLGPGEAVLLPEKELLPHEETLDPEIIGARASAFGRLARGQRLLVVTSWPALRRRVLPPEVFARYGVVCRVGQRLEPGLLAASLAAMGYGRVEMIEGQGQFSVRGGILDVFPFYEQNPLRLEFFDDEVDSIRTFGLASQRSLAKLEEATFWPAREGLWAPEAIPTGQERIREAGARQARKLAAIGRAREGEKLVARLDEYCERLAEHGYFPGADQFLPFLAELGTAFDYFARAKLILDEPVRGQEYLATAEMEEAKILSDLLERGVILPEEQLLYLGAEETVALTMAANPFVLSILAKSIKGHSPRHLHTFPAASPPPYHGNLDDLVGDLRRWRHGGLAVILVVGTAERGERLREFLSDQGLEATWAERAQAGLSPGNLLLLQGDLAEGVEFPQLKLVILSEAEIYGKQKRRRQARFTQEGVKITTFSDLTVGDYVVHLNHGIGQYMGLQTLEIGGVHRDYLQVKYAGDDKLFVPTDQVNLLQRYVGGEDAPPKLNRLGGAEWQRTKARVKESVREMADGLLRLYADRETIGGHAFGPDTVWQREFEESFIYEETPDQLRASEEIKRDMERPKPMDRLLCGDVGYGKTEVAVRAAFKAVMDGKQVAVLVPTTILAQQHYQTFSERFSGYPVTIRALSRFQSPREQAEVIKGLQQGTVEAVIGTHRLLSQDVTFKNLGLLIIDEEQRFGVAHKERLKELRKEVDVLTLTATPIPRTLHMAMVGIRDMSIIETPPEDRFPIRTYVMEYDEEVIREAIRREIDRRGQVFFVYNRVETIDRMAASIQALVPEARIFVAHGQMPEEQLERVMLEFLDGEADILLCTTIIESGLDIANVNTLVVYDADHLGLAQLYQLRGRVGRSNRLAHAYFTYRRDKVVGEAAEKRLAAIREFTDLGSGFKIALRDLEIRGAGNLLGPEQHGFIASVGFELYCRLLEEAIHEAKGQVLPETPDPVIDLKVDAFLPGAYISDPRQKVEIYKKIAAVKTMKDVDEIHEEIEDRFGDPPLPVRNLLAVAKVKTLAKQAGVSQIGAERGEVVVRFLSGLTLPESKAMEIARRFRGQVRVATGKLPAIRGRIAGLPDEAALRFLQEVLLLL